MSLHGYKPKTRRALWRDLPNAKEIVGGMSLKPRQQPVKRQRRAIPKQSKSIAARNRKYLKLREQFLKENPLCAIFAGEPAATVHHSRGRRLTREGDLLLATQFFIPASMDGHRWIEDHKESARGLTWYNRDGKGVPVMAPFGQFNTWPK